MSPDRSIYGDHEPLYVERMNGRHLIFCKAEGREEVVNSYEEAASSSQDCCSIEVGTKYGWQLLRKGSRP